MSLENREDGAEAEQAGAVGRLCPLTELEKARLDRQADVFDAYHFKRISRETFIRLMNDLDYDYYEARWEADQIRKEVE